MQFVGLPRMRGLVAGTAVLLLLIGFSSFVWVSKSHAQDAASYPNKPIRWIVPYGPGSPIDTHARKVSIPVSAKLGVPILVENRPGANGTIGANAVATAPPDGYTFLVTVSDPVVAATVVMKSLPYDPKRDFKYISKLILGTPMLVTNGTVQFRTLRELIDASKTMELSYGSFGPGSFPQIYLQGLAKYAGVKFKEVNYRGPPEIQHEVLNSQITMSMEAPILAGRFVAEGKMKPMAVVGLKRSRVLPDVPTFTEAGFPAPVLRNGVWTGLLGPAGLSDAIVAKTYSVIREAMQDPQVVEYVNGVGSEVLALSPSEFEKEYQDEIAIVLPLIRELGIVPQ